MGSSTDMSTRTGRRRRRSFSTPRSEVSRSVSSVRHSNCHSLTRLSFYTPPQGLFITVDAPQLGRREKDMRQKFDSDADGANVQAGDKVQKDQGAARAISSFIDAGLCWKDLDWFKSITKSTSFSPVLCIFAPFA